MADSDQKRPVLIFLSALRHPPPDQHQPQQDQANLHVPAEYVLRDALSDPEPRGDADVDPDTARAEAVNWGQDKRRNSGRN